VGGGEAGGGGGGGGGGVGGPAGGSAARRGWMRAGCLRPCRRHTDAGGGGGVAPAAAGRRRRGRGQRRHRLPGGGGGASTCRSGRGRGVARASGGRTDGSTGGHPRCCQWGKVGREIRKTPQRDRALIRHGRARQVDRAPVGATEARRGCRAASPTTSSCVRRETHVRGGAPLRGRRPLPCARRVGQRRDRRVWDKAEPATRSACGLWRRERGARCLAGERPPPGPPRVYPTAPQGGVPTGCARHPSTDDPSDTTAPRRAVRRSVARARRVWCHSRPVAWGDVSPHPAQTRPPRARPAGTNGATLRPRPGGARRGGSADAPTWHTRRTGWTRCRRSHGGGAPGRLAATHSRILLIFLCSCGQQACTWD